MRNEILKKLLSAYNKNPNSNLGKLLSILGDQLEEVKTNFELINEYRDIDNAKGKTLDLIGTNINQFRGTSTDEVYRVLIKSKIARSLSTGDINSIIETLSVALDVPYSDVGITEGDGFISLSSIPFDRLNEVGMTGEQLAMLIKKVVPTGIRVNPIEISGTFSFASGNTIETDTEAGFSDIEGTTGGYFGAVFETNNTNLPI